MLHQMAQKRDKGFEFFEAGDIISDSEEEEEDYEAPLTASSVVLSEVVPSDTTTACIASGTSTRMVLLSCAA